MEKCNIYIELDYTKVMSKKLLRREQAAKRIVNIRFDAA
jgi:hypothetical protein